MCRRTDTTNTHAHPITCFTALSAHFLHFQTNFFIHGFSQTFSSSYTRFLLLFPHIFSPFPLRIFLISLRSTQICSFTHNVKRIHARWPSGHTSRHPSGHIGRHSNTAGNPSRTPSSTHRTSHPYTSKVQVSEKHESPLGHRVV